MDILFSIYLREMHICKESCDIIYVNNSQVTC